MNGSNQHDDRNFLSTLPRIQNVKIALFNEWSSKKIKDFYQKKPGVSPLCNILTLFLYSLRSRDNRTFQKTEKTRERLAIWLVLLTHRMFLDSHGEQLQYMTIAGASMASEQRIETQLLKWRGKEKDQRMLTTHMLWTSSTVGDKFWFGCPISAWHPATVQFENP
jgi:hypothetical protein